jgi:hypothetical protein
MFRRSTWPGYWILPQPAQARLQRNSGSKHQHQRVAVFGWPLRLLPEHVAGDGPHLRKRYGHKGEVLFAFTIPDVIVSKKCAARQERSLDTIQQIYQGTSALRRCRSSRLRRAGLPEAAGISVGALYRFFPDKQEIIDAIAVRHMEEFRGRLQRLLVKVAAGQGAGSFWAGWWMPTWRFWTNGRTSRAIALGPARERRRRESQQMAPGAGPAGWCGCSWWSGWG